MLLLEESDGLAKIHGKLATAAFERVPMKNNSFKLRRAPPQRFGGRIGRF